MYKIYSKSNCQYCDKAKALLKSKKIEFDEFELDVHYTREELIEQFPTARTFPVILIDGNYIGGFDQLKERFNDE